MNNTITKYSDEWKVRQLKNNRSFDIRTYTGKKYSFSFNNGDSLFVKDGLSTYRVENQIPTLKAIIDEKLMHVMELRTTSGRKEARKLLNISLEHRVW